MSASVIAGAASSSCYVARTPKTNPCPTPLIVRKSKFHGYGLSLRPHNAKSLTYRSRSSSVRAKAVGAGKTIEVEVEKPLGLTLGQKPAGGVVITAVEGGGNAARAGLKAGDQVLYTSSFFGDELWPADKLGFTKTAIQAKPDSVYFVISRGAAVDVKRLPKRPAPPRFGQKLTDTQKARATHICLDCGYIYTLTKPFDEQASESSAELGRKISGIKGRSMFHERECNRLRLELIQKENRRSEATREAFLLKNLLSSKTSELERVFKEKESLFAEKVELARLYEDGVVQAEQSAIIAMVKTKVRMMRSSAEERLNWDADKEIHIWREVYPNIDFGENDTGTLHIAEDNGRNPEGKASDKDESSEMGLFCVAGGRGNEVQPEDSTNEVSVSDSA